MTYAYIRVSTRDQNEDRQLAALTNLGISEVNLFLDKQSGKDFNRPAYRKLHYPRSASRSGPGDCWCPAGAYPAPGCRLEYLW